MKAKRRSRKQKTRKVENQDAGQQPAWQQINQSKGKGKKSRNSYNALPNQVGKRYWRM